MIYFISNQLIIPTKDVKQSNMDDLYLWLDKNKEFGFDVETSGLDFLDDTLLLLSIGNEKTQWVIDCISTPLCTLNKYFESEDWLKIAHNVTFDYKFLKHKKLKINKTYCTAISEEVITKGQIKKSETVYERLSTLTMKYLQVELVKSQRHSFIDKTTNNFSIEDIIYSANDVKYLIPIMNKQNEIGKRYDLINVITLDNISALAFADMEYNGMKIDVETWKALDRKVIEQIAILKFELDNIILTDELFKDKRKKYLQLDIFKPIEELDKVGILWSSHAQVLPILQLIDNTIKTTNKVELDSFTESHKLINTLVKLRETQKLHTTYGEKFLKHIRSDGKIHTNFYLVLNTGRVSTKPNLQNIPTLENLYRNCFIPDEGYDWVSADYASQELALIAYDAQDLVWMKALKKDEDLHSSAAEIVYEEEWKNTAESDCEFYKNKKKCKCKNHKILRQNVKYISFGLAFGMEAGTLAKRLKITLIEAKQLMEKYFKAFPNIKTSLNRSAIFAMQHGYIYTLAPFKRRRWFKDWAGKNTWSNIKAEIERQAKNSRIQGSGANILKYALCLIRKELNNNIKFKEVKLIMQVHDQIDCNAPKNISKEFSIKLKNLMEEAASVVIPGNLLKVDVKITDKWEK